MTSSAHGTFTIGGDLTVDRIGFGAMRLARNGMDTAARDPETGRAVLRRAAELGVDPIDTADFYRSADGPVRANDLIREALFPTPRDWSSRPRSAPSSAPAAPPRAPPPTSAPPSRPT
jgi:pyridoxine 4-dehydrogenase